MREVHVFRSASVIAVLALAYVVAPGAAAGQLPRARFGIGGGMAMPSGEFHADEFGDGFNLGWQGMLLMEFKAPKKRIGLRVDVGTGENPANDQLNADASAFVGFPVTSKLRTLGGNLDLVYHLGRSKRGGGAYVLGGVGSHRVTLSVMSQGVTADTSETKFAWNAGGGLTFPVAGVTAFLEARYFNVSSSYVASEKLQYVAVMAGVRFGGE
jgi:opacity protein-like surface antigen